MVDAAGVRAASTLESLAADRRDVLLPIHNHFSLAARDVCGCCCGVASGRQPYVSVWTGGLSAATSRAGAFDSA